MASDPFAPLAPPHIDTAALLDETANYLRAYVVLSKAQQVALALWVAHTHAFEAAEATPYGHVTSAEMESGKTLLLEALELVVARPVKASGPTAAALARAIAEKPPPTMLLDESDNTFKRDPQYVATLTGILNDGYRRGGRTLLCLPPKWQPSLLPVFGPKALAGIGELPGTVASRSIRIELKKRTSGEHIERFRQRTARARAEPLQARLAAWAEANVETLSDARPELPDELSDRAQDVWEPLLAIADLAGGAWPADARAAALELSSAAAGDTRSIRVRLHADIRQAMNEHDRIKTSDLLAFLHELEESPWGEWNGKPLTAHGLAKLLRPFHIASRTIRLADGTTAKGYLREQFEDAWARYLPIPPPPKRHTVTTRIVERKTGTFKTSHDPPGDGFEKGANPHGCGDVTDVTVWNADIGVSGENDVDPEEIERVAALWVQAQAEQAAQEGGGE